MPWIRALGRYVHLGDTDAGETPPEPAPEAGARRPPPDDEAPETEIEAEPEREPSLPLLDPRG